MKNPVYHVKWSGYDIGNRNYLGILDRKVFNRGK